MTESAATRRCARHPERAAETTCERCGDFVCAGCASPRKRGLCLRCGERLGLPWERGGRWWWRYLKTYRSLILAPASAHPYPGTAGPALRFFGIGLVLKFLVSSVPILVSVTVTYAQLGIAGLPLEVGILVAEQLFTTLALPSLFVVLAALAYGGTAALAGAEPRWSSALRVAAYAASLPVLTLPLGWAYRIARLVPQGELVAGVLSTVIGTLLIPVLQLRLWSTLADHDTRRGGRRWLASLGPALLILAFAVFAVALRSLVRARL